MADVTIKIKDFSNRIDGLITDGVMESIHKSFAKICEPYVPMDEGVLSQGTEITPEYLKYKGPYAHYMYMGEVYGPNIPRIDKDTGEIIGWWSPPNQKKYPTGREMEYSKEKHPKATKEWDKVAMQNNKETLVREATEIIKREAKERNGR